MKTLIAIDPGKNGTVAWRDCYGTLGFKKCPQSEREMVEVLASIMYEADGRQVLIEEVHGGVFAPPGEKCEKCGQSKSKIGAKSQFNFGRNFGTWLGILSAIPIPFRETPPKTWQTAFGNLPKDSAKRKAEVHRRVQNRFPDLKVFKYAADAVAILAVMIDGEKEPPASTAPAKAPDQPDLFAEEW